ncbi:helix-turn-helix transcriptional regulator [Funiculus sociatus]|uniref:helix-turn-helix transcriptional regulator n=1 Tax=Funiculus sociatus TaxID=450527 RepID=UPI0032987979
MSKRNKGQQPQELDSPLRRLREDADLTQEQLAVEIDVSVSTLRRWEKGTEPAMTRRQWIRFCRAVNKDFDELPEDLVGIKVIHSGANASQQALGDAYTP